MTEDKFDVKNILGFLKKDCNSVQKSVNTLCEVSKDKDDNYKADCCEALRKLYSLTDDKTDEFTAGIWNQINEFIFNTYNTVVSPEALLKVIRALVFFYENSSKGKIKIPWIPSLYTDLAHTLAYVVIHHQNCDGDSNEEYKNLIYLAYESNLCLLKTFEKRAIDDFVKMEAVLNTILHRKRSSFEIKLGLKMYADFVKKASFKKENPLKCPSYRFRHILTPAIVKFLNDDRFDIVDAACRLVLSLVHYGGPVFHEEMEFVLPELLNMMNKYNECKFCEELYGINKSSVATNDWEKITRNLAKTICETANSIFSSYAVNINPVKGMEFLIFSIILCDTEKDWDKVYNASQHLFRSFDINSGTNFMMIWDMACRLLTRVTQEEDCFIEMLMVSSHILKKFASIFCYGCTTDIPKDQSFLIKIFYEKMDDILVKFKISLDKNKIENNGKSYKYDIVLTNLYVTNRCIYKSTRVCWAHSHFENILIRCEYMFYKNRYAFEHKFVMLLHADMIEASHEDISLVSKYKDKLMPLALKCLTQTNIDVGWAAIRLLGKVSCYGGKCYEIDCKTALPLIARLLDETEVCRNKVRTISYASQLRESASSTMATIMERYNYRGQNEKAVLSQWLDSFPVLMNPRAAEISYEYLLKLIKEKNKIILGPNYQNMARIITIFCLPIHFKVFEERSNIIKKIEKMMREEIVFATGSQYNYLESHITAHIKTILTKCIKNAPKCYKI